MFAVIFEVRPDPGRWDDYLGIAGMLRPELETIDGFVDNVRYKSLTREGWLLSLSSWRDEKAVVRWRTTARHHVAQEKGRSGIMLDYHLRVGQVTHDTRVPAGQKIAEQRLDETEIGRGTAVTLIDASRPPGLDPGASASETAACLGLDPDASGMVGWDLYDAILRPGDLILVMTWKARPDAEVLTRSVALPAEGRLRQVRIVRDYGMFDRREAPQYYPDVERRQSGA
jgi:heme-degrading monooxygenase HmoA